MIKTFQLLFEPATTWEKIARAKKSLPTVLFMYLTPLLVLSVAGELFGRIYLGRQNVTGMAKMSQGHMVEYGVTLFLLNFLVVFLGARLVKSVADTFHARHDYTHCFTAVAYGLSPLFIVRLLDAMPAMNPWISFAIGIALSVATLYQGIPCVLRPDPPTAFGLFLMSGVLLAMVSGLARLITLLVLQGRINLI